jgi:hypothetical protein
MKYQWFSITAALLSSSCLGPTTDSPSAALKSEMTILLHEIRAAVSDKYCKKSSDCDVLDFGDRPCGGPSKTFIYSKIKTKTDILLSKSKRYTYLEKLANHGKNKFSDCSLLVPPMYECKNFRCERLNQSIENDSELGLYSLNQQPCFSAYTDSQSL